jgi:hypothetical protein
MNPKGSETIMAESLVHELEIPQSKADVNIQIEQVLSQVRQLEILIPDMDDVTNYLIHFPDIIGLIIPICILVNEKFKPPTQVSLEVYHDPEIVDEYIFIEIRQKNYDRSVMKRIEEIGSEYEKSLIDKEGWIVVSTDYRQPR